MKIVFTFLLQLIVFQITFGNAADYVTFHQYKNYQGKYEKYQEGSYYIKSIKVQPYSIQIPDNYEVKFEYQNKYGKKKSYLLKSSHKNLKYEMDKWQLRDKDKPYKYITKIVVYKKNNHQNANHSSGEGDDYIKKGYAVFYKSKGYKNEFKYFKEGAYSANNIGWTPYSVKLPKGVIMEITYMDRHNKTKKYQCQQHTQDLYAQMEKWQVKDRRNPWQYVRKIEIKKYNGHANHSEDNNMNKEAEKKYKQVYVVFFKGSHYTGDYYGKMQGTYYPKNLKFIPYGLLIPSSKYIVFEYLNKQKRTKSEVFKGKIPDLMEKLKSLGVYHQHDPKQSIRKITIMKY